MILKNIILIGIDNYEPYPLILSKLSFKDIDYQKIKFYNTKKLLIIKLLKKLNNKLSNKYIDVFNNSFYKEFKFIKSKYFKKNKQDKIKCKILSSEFKIYNKKINMVIYLN